MHPPPHRPMATRSGHISLGFRETLQLGGPPCTASAPSSSSLGVCLGREGTRTLLATVCGSQHGVVAPYPHPKQAVTPGTFGDPFTFTSFST